MRDEIELIRAASAGDEQAFGELVEWKREMVVRTAYQVTGDLDDALDVAQGVFLKLWRGLGRFDVRRRFDTWIYRITVNAAIDNIRARGPKGILQPLPDDPGEMTDNGLYLPQTVLEKEKVQSGRIMAMGPGIPLPDLTDADEEPWRDAEQRTRYLPMQAQEGDYALFLKKSAVEIKFEGDDYLVVPQSSILILLRDIHDE